MLNDPRDALLAGGVEYFADAGMQSLKGDFKLDGVTREQVTRDEPKSKSNFAFVIQTPNRKWQLKASSQADYDEWEKQIFSLL